MAFVYKYLPKAYFGMAEHHIAGIVEATRNMWKTVAESKDHYARIIIHNSHYNLESYIQKLTIQRARSGDRKWQLNGLTSLINTLRRSGMENLYQPYVYLVLFDKKQEDADDFAILFANQTNMEMIGSPEDGTTLPTIIKNSGQERQEEIFTQPNDYWRTFYITNFEGEHDIYSPLFNLVKTDFEMMVAFDIHSYATSSLVQKMDLVHNQAIADINKGQGNPISRQRLERRMSLIREARDLIMTKQEAMHEISGAITIHGNSVDELRDRQSAILSATNGYYKISNVRGMQAKALEFFTTKHPKEITLPGKVSRNVLTSNIALSNLNGNGFPQPGGNSGIWYGDSYLNGHPIIYNGFGENKNDANHSVILGSTGSGKTVLLQTMAYRSLMDGVQVIVLEPRGHFRRLHRVIDESTYNDMGFEVGYSINIFDLVYDDVGKQISHVINALSLLLHRDFDNTEVAVLRNSITNLYMNYDYIYLQNLVVDLNDARWAEHGREVETSAKRIANLIEISVLKTDLNDIFNRETSGIDLGLDSVALSVFDFEKVNPEYQGLLYYLILANLNNYCVAHKNQRNRVIIVDEYYLMSQIPQLAESLALFFKTFRTYGVAVWVAEQDWYTLTGFEGQKNKHGEYLISNAANVIALYHNTLKDAQALGAIIPELSDQLLGYITGSRRPGTGIIKLKESILPFRLELTEQEKRLFVGS